MHIRGKIVALQTGDEFTLVKAIKTFQGVVEEYKRHASDQKYATQFQFQRIWLIDDKKKQEAAKKLFNEGNNLVYKSKEELQKAILNTAGDDNDNL